MMKIGVFEENFSELLINTLRERYVVSFFRDDYAQFLSEIEVLFIRLKHRIDKQILDMAPNLKYICTPTTGLNHIDIQEVERREIELFSLKGETEFLNSIRATPEHTFGLALSLLRNYTNLIMDSDTDWTIRNGFQGSELSGNRAGIIGYGRVGRILAQYLDSFGCKTRYYDTKNVVNQNKNIIKESSINSLIGNSNLIFLCASYSKENENFIDKKYLDLMRGKYFINTARGELVDEENLIERINQGFFKGVALDVIANESGENNLDRFLGLVNDQNLIITPHIAGATKESMQRTDMFIVDKLEKKLNAGG